MFVFYSFILFTDMWANFNCHDENLGGGYQRYVHGRWAGVNYWKSKRTPCITDMTGTTREWYEEEKRGILRKLNAFLNVSYLINMQTLFVMSSIWKIHQNSTLDTSVHYSCQYLEKGRTPSLVFHHFPAELKSKKESSEGILINTEFPLTSKICWSNFAAIYPMKIA